MFIYFGSYSDTHLLVRLSRLAKKCTQAGADLVNWGPQANIGMGPYKFAHIYQIKLEVPFLVVMLAAAQWCPIVVSNVSTFFMYML